MARVRFEVEFPDAQKVFIAGDFNAWDPEGRRMKRLRKGEALFLAVLDLDPGTYQFKYVVDGEWVPCPQSARVGNEHGTENSVVVVEEEPA